MSSPASSVLNLRLQVYDARKDDTLSVDKSTLNYAVAVSSSRVTVVTRISLKCLLVQCGSYFSLFP